MYKLLQDLQDAELDELIPDEDELNEYLSEYKDYSNTIYDEHYKRNITVTDFMQMFGIHEDEEMTIEEQLDQTLDEIIGITRTQLKFIDTDLVFLPEKLPTFIDVINHPNIVAIESIEQRIKIATLITWIDDNAAIDKDYFEQYISIMKSNEFTQAIAVTRKWTDYYNMIIEINSTFGSKDFRFKVSEENQIELWKTFEKFNNNRYIKPSHIDDMHNKMVRFKRLFDSVYEKNDAEFKNLMMDENSKTSLYKKFLYTGSTFSVCPIKNYDELVREGDMLNHCVKEYADDIIENKCLIYAIRNNEQPDTPFFTVEIKRGATLLDEKPFRLTQCYGYDDTEEKSNELYEFIHTWCQTKGINIECIL